ncbi:MAG: GtrA family protein [Firmicutes bacterium HGW-Firmicutes-21]|nr:MAG: GtrA family protein [Firmicutes bacterium HGW-Firmicutes-21]
MKVSFINKQNIFEFIRYAFVGGIAFLFDTGVLQLFYELILPDKSFLFFNIEETKVIIATAVGFAVGLTVNYLLSIFFVFKTDKQKKESKKLSSFGIYFLVGIIGFVFTELGMIYGTKLVGADFLVMIKMVVAGFVLIWNYVGRKIFVYKGD